MTLKRKRLCFLKKKGLWISGQVLETSFFLFSLANEWKFLSLLQVSHEKDGNIWGKLRNKKNQTRKFLARLVVHFITV